MIRLMSAIFVLIFSLTLNAQMNQNNLLIESESKYNFAQTVDKLTKIVELNNWKVVIIHDLQASLKKNEKEVLPIKILEICNPNYSFNVLKKDEFRYFSSIMPCRISVYEKMDGKTYVSRINSAYMNEVLKNLQCKSMQSALEDIDKFISEIIK